MNLKGIGSLVSNNDGEPSIEDMTSEHGSIEECNVESQRKAAVRNRSKAFDPIGKPSHSPQKATINLAALKGAKASLVGLTMHKKSMLGTSNPVNISSSTILKGRNQAPKLALNALLQKSLQNKTPGSSFYQKPSAEMVVAKKIDKTNVVRKSIQNKSFNASLLSAKHISTKLISFPIKK